jgi:hypothetical protein
MAVPKPQPKDWLKAAADELRLGDRETLALLQEAYRNINRILKGLPDTPDAAFGNLIYRAQLERTRQELLKEQARLFDKLGDKVAARRLKSASRAAKLSAASDAALLALVGEGEDGQRLYDGAGITSQRVLETILARMGLSQVPLAERIYKTSAWMNKRLDRLITQTMAAGLNARRFAKVARDWFAPSVPGGTRYAAYRLARTEINNAFHATSVSYAQGKPWVSEMDWNLSKSHPEPDKCDAYAAASPWNVTEIPRKPHPQCMCYVTEITPDEDEWIDRFVAGEFDDYLDGELAKLDERDGLSKVSKSKEPVKVSSTPIVSDPEPIKPEPEPLTGQAAHDVVLKGLYKRGSLTPKQRKAAKIWETGWFMVINNLLRRDDLADPEYKSEVQTIAQLDSAYAESVLPAPIQTWRGMYSSRRLFGDRFDGDLTGFSWEEKGYSSTTTNEDIVNQFNLEGEAENVKIRVTVDAGVQALEVSTETRGSADNGPQAEIALQRGLKWTIEKDNGYDDTGRRLLEVRVSAIDTGADTPGADARATGRKLSSSSPGGAD